ncbi:MULTISPECIES: RNA polymerase sigma factor [Pseudomonas]|jgi:RNA polymerase sigma factor (sigma-70 family)|uniref:RNA polymerase sigma factor n=2 Tax=Pseudomonas TaxID=286 RepID=C8BNT9_PSESY|nr:MULTISPECIES: RNA polymerase sigma factor [Pseudomonas]ACU65031.1 HrpL [Pseudomonas syringae pv. syringae]KPW82064.1 RNA polymerase sigma factor [Pseudomonas congelans]MBC8800321.1 RNA polymerase sigma factor [Pseudomonas congelans]MBP1144312.1 RNA polymerase sigma factor (sigma-70 family) [Pseudomonas sp. PvP027]PBP88532.1 RNA polymerase sigma factor [Pseudomonas congelans]
MNAMNQSLLPTPSGTSCFAQLTQQQLQKLQNFIRKRVIHQEDAEDILQQTFVEALHAEGKFLQQSKPETWLCGIALNLIRNHFRKVYRRPMHVEFEEQLAHAEPTQDIFGHIESYRDLQQTVQAISVLPAVMRHTLEITVETEGSYQEAADALGVPIGTIRSRLSRARSQLRDCLPEGFRA